MGRNLANTIFNKTSTRVFCITGVLDDIFCTQDLQIRTFEELLCGHLHNKGYDAVVFYSGADKKLFSIDDASANIMQTFLKRNKNKASKFAGDTLKIREEKSDTQKEQSYALAGTDDEHFLALVDRAMDDCTYKKAIVITNLSDFILHSINSSSKEGAERQRTFNALCEKWRSYHDNDNILIFLSKSLDMANVQNLLRDPGYASIASVIFDSESMSINNNACLVVDCPRNDEILNIIQYLRIIGYKGKRLFFDAGERAMRALVRNIVYYSREGRITSLKMIYELLCKYMEAQDTDLIYIDSDIIISEVFKKGKKGSNDEEYIETLKNTEGWEPAYEVISSIIKSYERYERNSGAKIEVEEESMHEQLGVCYVERLEKKECMSSEYRVPSIVLQGPPGVGKSEIATLIGRIFQQKGILKSGHTVRARRDDLVGEYIGSTAIKTSKLIERAQEGILFVDEVYSLIDNDDESSKNYCKEAINTLVAAMTEKGNRMCVVFAGYKDKMENVWKMNEGLASRFSDSNIITLNEYKPALLKKIFLKGLEKNSAKLLCEEDTTEKRTGFVVCDDEKKDDLSIFFKNFFDDRDRAQFGNARDVNNLLESVMRTALVHSTDDDSVVYIAKEDFGERVNLFKKRGIDEETIFQKIDGENREYVGLEWLKDILNDIRDAKAEYRLKGREEDYPGPMHMIWKGNPGAGKSTAAKLLAEFYHSLGIFGSTEPIYVDASELVGHYIGGAQENVNKYIDKAVNQNTVMVVEEAYQLSQSEFGRNAIDAMMNRMEDDRKKFNLIFVLYEEKYADFISINPGLESRTKSYSFRDYNGKELSAIFDIMLKKADDSIEAEAKKKVELLLEEVYERSKFAANGNARTVRKLHEAMRAKRNRRLQSDEKMNLVLLDNMDSSLWEYKACDVPEFEELFDGSANNARSIDDICQKFAGAYRIKRIMTDINDNRAEYKLKGKVHAYPGPKHMIWIGNVGTGRITAIKLLAEFYRSVAVFDSAEPVYVNAQNLDRYDINKYIDEAIRHNTVMVVEEAYQLSKSDFGRYSIGCMVRRMEQEQKKFNLVLLFSKEEYEDFIRFNQELKSMMVYEFDDYTKEELSEIFDLMLQKEGDAIASEAREKVDLLFEEIYSSGYIATKENARIVKKLYELMHINRNNRFRKQEIHLSELKSVDSSFWKFISEDVPALNELFSI